MKRLRLVGLGGLALVLATGAGAQDLASFEKRITVETLDNGLTVIVCERPVAPVFSFFTHVDVGGAQEVPGITGLAHMFEHMAFKGTDTIGTTDYAAEKVALEKVEVAYRAYDEARRRPTGRDENEVQEKKKAWEDAIAAAGEYVVQNQFPEIIERQGGVGMNAFTSNDETGYHYSLPGNRLELWAYLESERFLKPVLREFYKERDVVMEERRRRESQPVGRLVEQFLAVAYSAHPYKQPVLGYMSDLQAFSATDAAAFYERYYVPSNMVLTVAGDVTAAEVLPLIRRYFGRIPAGTRPEPLRTVEPPQIGEKEVVLIDPAQPFYLEGYHKPSIHHPDDPVYDAIGDILSNGRVSRLYRSLVRDKRIAAVAAGFNGYPGQKYPNMFIFYGVPLPGKTNDDVRDAIREEIERLKTEDVTDAELQMVKTRAKASLIRGLGDNGGLAQQLGTYQALLGDWRELFRSVDRIDAVTSADIRRVANEVFVPSNRTVGRIETQAAEAAPSMETES